MRHRFVMLGGGLALLLTAACSSDRDQAVDHDASVEEHDDHTNLEEPPIGDWETAYAPAAVPEPRAVLLEDDYPNQLPDRPIELSEPVYRPASSGRALTATGDRLYAVDTENGALVVLDRLTAVTERVVPLEGRPHQVVVGSDGTAYVTLRHGAAVARIRPDATTAEVVPVGVEPTGLALDAKGETLFVALRAEGALVALDVESMTELERFSGLDRPLAVATDAYGGVYVAGRSEHVDTLKFVRTGGIPAFTPSTRRPLRTWSPPDLMLHPGRVGRTVANRATAVVASPAEHRVLVAHHATESGTPQDSLMAAVVTVDGSDGADEQPTPPEGGYGAGGMNSAEPHLVRPVETVVTVVDGNGADVPRHFAAPVKDPETLEPLTALLSQPSDINHHPTWSLALVTGFGSDNVLVLNTAYDDPMSSPLGIIRVGQAPAAVTFSPDGRLAYVLNAHDFTISRIDLSPFFEMESVPIQDAGAFLGTDGADGFADDMGADGVDPELVVGMTPHDPVRPIRSEHQRVIRIGEDPLAPEARLGRRIFTYAFNDALSEDRHFACRSCHLEGGEDGLVWFVTDGPRQTPALAGRLHDTAPFNWNGSEGALQNNMERTIARMGGHGLDPAELESLEQFLVEGLVPPPNPHRSPDGLTEQQARGKQLFQDPKVGCAGCHAGPSQTDGLLHDVGTATDLELELAHLRNERLDVGQEQPVVRFNTPSLRNLHATAPYLHDGSAKTLREVLKRTSTTMGRTDHLTPSELDDLVAYLLTL